MRDNGPRAERLRRALRANLHKRKDRQRGGQDIARRPDGPGQETHDDDQSPGA